VCFASAHDGGSGFRLGPAQDKHASSEECAGAKQIYVYKDVKVTFLNGKISNVQ
jgi:hypothetical protein